MGVRVTAETFGAACRAAGLPAPVAEVMFARPRKWRFDWAWPDRLIALEIEGGVWLKGGGRHNRGAGFVKDLEKYNAAAILGWRIIRCTPQQFESGAVLADLAKALGS
jgi:hypothetical protein